MAQISIPGAAGSHLTFTVTGTSTTNYATAFAAAVNLAATSGSLTLNVVNAAGTPTVGSTVLNELVAGSKTTFQPFTGQYTAIDETATVTGSAFGHDTIIAGSDTAASGLFSATYIQSGSDNLVTFINGTNTYDGSSGSESGDTITSGAGSDTINTGHGSSTVFSGSGTSLITLNNTTGSDVVFLGDGLSTVVANGVNDTVAAASDGQLILGGAAGSSLTVGIEASSVAGPANDIIVGRASALTVFDSVGGNQIFGGSGNLTFVGQSGSATPVADTILTGSGFNVIVGFANADITFASTSTSGGVGIVAGTGNETLNGANATNFTVFGDTTAAASSSSTFVGSYDSTANDFFSTGAGNQAYVAGNATDVFQLDTVVGGNAHITIFGFSNADNLVGFGNDTVNAQKDLSTGTVTGGNLTITLSDNTTVTFVGVTTLTGHTI